MSVTPPTLDQLTARAEAVVRAEVTAIACQWDDAPSGRQVIHTYVTCKVLKTLKGTAGDTLTLRILGGQVGETRMEIPEMPAFAVGEQYVLFVAANGRAFCPLVGAGYGQFRVVKDATGAERVAGSDGVPRARAADFEQAVAARAAADR